jgi:serine/threonine protein kinase
MNVIILAYYEPAVAPPFSPSFQALEVAAAFGVTAARPLGAGAFGETWRLEAAGAPHRAAKLILDPNYPPDRLDREIEGLRRANSPHVVDLVEARQVTIGGDNRSALVFEFIDGGDVASRLRPGAAVPADDVREFARGLVAGVAELHSQQTVHRDIKPENIAVRGGDWAQPVLLDLGLAKVLDQQSLTAYPTLMGTVPFMAPEQLRGERARQLADMFAVGVVLYLLLTGRHPYYGPRALALDHLAAIQRLENGPAPLPGATPTDLAELVNRLLSAEAYRRGSAARALDDLSG